MNSLILEKTRANELLFFTLDVSGFLEILRQQGLSVELTTIQSTLSEKTPLANMTDLHMGGRACVGRSRFRPYFSRILNACTTRVSVSF